MKRKKYQCVLCGGIRYVKTYPRSNCRCEVRISKYMKTSWKLIGFFTYCYQQLKIHIKLGRWHHINNKVKEVINLGDDEDKAVPDEDKKDEEEKKEE